MPALGTPELILILTVIILLFGVGASVVLEKNSDKVFMNFGKV